MEIIFLDNDAHTYPERTKGSVSEKSCGKFVQMRHHNTEYLILSPLEYAPYHADLVKLFCLENEIDGIYIESQKRYDIHDPAWIVVGGGKFDLDNGRQFIRLYDNSMAYGKFNAAGLKESVQQTATFAGYEISVE